MPAKKKKSTTKKPTKKKPTKRKKSHPQPKKRGKRNVSVDEKPLRNLSKSQREYRRQEQRLAELSKEQLEAALKINVYVVLETPFDQWHLVSAHHVESVAREVASQAENLRVDRRLLEGMVRFNHFTKEEALAWLEEEDRKLTQEEIDEAAATKLWVVWYEDQFSAGPDRDPAFPTAFYLDEPAAKADGDVQRRPLEPSWDGYSVTEGTLYEHFRFRHLSRGAVRELLACKRAR